MPDTNIGDLELAVLRSKVFDERLHPRDPHSGEFTSTPGGGGGGDTEETRLRLADERKILYGQHEGTPDDPVPCGGDIERAARVLENGGHVTLNQPDEVATLLDKLRDIVKEAEDKGEKAPNYDLCNVSVPGTNLFCQDEVKRSDGTPIERVQMPQLSTKDPVPGSEADKMPRNKKGEVDLSRQFGEFLASSGRATTNTTIDASHLRASQSELNGGKVAGIAGAVAAGKIDVNDPKGAIYVTRDNYVIDGHHRWAAYVAESYRTGETIDMPVIVVDTDIGEALTLANFWTEEMGIPAADVTKKAFHDPHLYAAAIDTPELLEVLAKFSETQPRDAEGQWTGRPGETAGRPDTPTDMVHWTRFDDAETRLGDARKYEGEHVLAIMRSGPSHSGNLHVGATAMTVGEDELNPSDVRQIAVYGNWAKAGNAGNASSLIRWFNEGAGGAIAWGSPGDWAQCVAIASAHMGVEDAKGFCQNRHQEATGMSTAEHAHNEGKAGDFTPSLHPRDEHGRFTDSGGGGAPLAGAAVPPLPGETPIPPGTVRLFHITPLQNAEAISEHGLTRSTARGESYGEPNQIWASSGVRSQQAQRVTDGGLMDSQFAVVEFWAPPDQLDIGHWEKPEDLEARASDVTFYGDVSPEQIIAVHEPWHAAYRYLSEYANDVRKGEYDWAALDNSNYARAIEKIKNGKDFTPSLHPRYPRGTPGGLGGQFMPGVDGADVLEPEATGMIQAHEAELAARGLHVGDEVHYISVPMYYQGPSEPSRPGSPEYIVATIDHVDNDGIHLFVPKEQPGRYGFTNDNEDRLIQADQLASLDALPVLPEGMSPVEFRAPAAGNPNGVPRYLLGNAVFEDTDSGPERVGILSPEEMQGVVRLAGAQAGDFHEGDLVVTSDGDVGTLMRIGTDRGDDTATIRLNDGRVLADIAPTQHAGTWETPPGWIAAGVRGLTTAREVYMRTETEHAVYASNTDDESGRVYAIEYPASWQDDVTGIAGLRAAVEYSVNQNHEMEKDSGLKNRWRGTIKFDTMEDGVAAYKDWNCSIAIGDSVLRDIPEGTDRVLNPKDVEDGQGVLSHELAHGLSHTLYSGDYKGHNIPLEEGVAEAYREAFMAVKAYGPNAPSPYSGGQFPPGYMSYNAYVTGVNQALLLSRYNPPFEYPAQEEETWTDRLDWARDLLQTPLPERQAKLDKATAASGEHVVFIGTGHGSEMGYTTAANEKSRAPQTADDVKAIIMSSLGSVDDAERALAVVRAWIDDHPEDGATIGMDAECLHMLIAAQAPDSGEKAGEFTERLHPRDEHGRFAETGGSALRVQYEEALGRAIVVARASDGEVVGRLRLNVGTQNEAVVESVDVVERLRGQGVATQLAVALHEHSPDVLLVHRDPFTAEGRAWAQAMVREYPNWNVIRSESDTTGSSLTRTDYEGQVGNTQHITAIEEGHIPTAAIRYLRGVMGEVPGDHRNIQGEDWEKFKQDIAANGIKQPIFITVDHGEQPKISEGNHRRDAAVELGMENVPVEIRYFGHAEQEGTVAERYSAGNSAVPIPVDLPDDPAELLELLDNGLDTPEEVGAAIAKLGAIKVEFDAPGVDAVYLHQPVDGGEPTVIEWSGDDSFSETHNAYDWVGEQDASDYYPNYDQEFSDQFWQRPDVLYHGTDPDRIPEIMSEGLQMRSETRGLSNRYEGAAVYTSTEPDEAEYYYGQVLVIDTAAMAADGLKPFVSQEPDVSNANLEEALASAIGLFDFEAETEGGMSPSTIVVNGDIPTQYITVMELAKAILEHRARKEFTEHLHPRDERGRFAETAGHGWDGFPFDERKGEGPREGDTPPERTPEGDFVMYHSTSPVAAASIVGGREILPDDFNAVGLATTPEAARIYGIMKAGPNAQVLRVTVSQEWLSEQRAQHEIGGSGHDQFLIQPAHGSAPDGWEGLPSDAIVDIRPALTAADDYRKTWKPDMTPEEGHAWAEAAGTKIPQTVVHMTEMSNVDGIKGTGFNPAAQSMHEYGRYFAVDPDTAAFYEYKGNAAVSTVVVAQNPLVLDWRGNVTSDFARAGEFREAALEAAGIDPDAVIYDEDLSEFRAADSAEDTTTLLKAAGYDSVSIFAHSGGNEDPTTGGDQLIVFDREQAVVIGTETVPSMTNDPTNIWRTYYSEEDQALLPTQPEQTAPREVWERYWDEVDTFQRTHPNPEAEALARAFAKFNPDQLRDRLGRWAETGGAGTGGGGGGGGLTPLSPTLSDRAEQGGSDLREALIQDARTLPFSDDPAIAAKIANMVHIGKALAERAKKDPALKSQLGAIGQRVIRADDPQEAQNQDLVPGMYLDANGLTAGDPVGYQWDHLSLEEGMTLEEVGGRQAAAKMQDAWMQSATDDSQTSWAVQIAAGEHLGVPDSAAGYIYDAFEGSPADTWSTDEGAILGLDPATSDASTIDRLYEMAHSRVVKAYVDQVYSDTQKFLADRGITEVASFRGVEFDPDQGPEDPFGSNSPDPQVREVGLNPLSSFSTSDTTAYKFAHAGRGDYVTTAYIIEATVPADRIFSIPVTGPGCLEETEMLVAGGTVEARVTPVTNPEDSPWDGSWP